MPIDYVARKKNDKIVLNLRLVADRNSIKMLALALLLLLVVAVRIYYNSGPIFGNVQDEGIYLTIISQQVVFHDNGQGFAQYKGINFSDYSLPAFNPANIFIFYTGFLYPIEALTGMFGYSTNLIVYYVIFTAAIEGLAIFLILDYISGLRAAVIGTAIFAFFPLDAIFSNRVMPPVPMAALLALGTYFFIRKDTMKGRKRMLFAGIAGAMVGFAYLTHPEGIILLLVVVLAGIYMLVTQRKSWRLVLTDTALVLVGFLLAYSVMGFYYLATANNFLLYPMVDHDVFLYQAATQPLYNVSLGHNVVMTYTTGTPASYINRMFRTEFTKSLQVNYGMFYFSILGYLAVAFSVFLIFKPKMKYGRFFVCIFWIYFLALSFLPTSVRMLGGKLDLLIVNSVAMYGIVLVLPAVIIVAIGLDRIMTYRQNVIRLMAVAIILAIIAFSITELNFDSANYRNSIYTVYSFINFVKQNPNATYYGYPQFIGEVSILTNFRYLNNVKPFFSCYKDKLPNLNGSYIVLGGTINMDLTPQIIQGFDQCVEENVTNTTLVLNVYNNYQPNIPLEIYKVN